MTVRDSQLQRISRRGLISSAVLAGVLSASGMPVAAHRRGGVLRLGLSGPEAPWDPRLAQGSFMRVATQGAIHDTLTEISAAGELVGELATAWEPAAGAAVWTVHLRAGVSFHDGRPLRAADVAASLALHRAGSPATPILDRIADMRAMGPLQVRFTLTAPDANFPLLLADPHLTIAPEGRFDGVGTGLYRLAEHDPGERLRLTRVEGHWRDGRAGWFDAVVLRPMPEARARTSALLLGHVDAVDFPAEGATIARRRDLRLIRTGSHGIALDAAGMTGASVAGLDPVAGAPPAGPVMAAHPAYAGLPGGIAGAIYGQGADTLVPGARPETGPHVAHLPFTLACNDRLRHDGIGSLGAMDAGRIAERWWFA
ncbi:MAG: hypothetical protein IT542_03635 [Rubellimicrobium sp.]|nr:hypothetical protein [Rubellimicrobium sp.]